MALSNVTPMFLTLKDGLVTVLLMVTEMSQSIFHEVVGWQQQRILFCHN